MTFAFNQATRLYTPIIAGIAGPSKSGKTYSALRVAAGLANGGKVAMINTEGPNGHQYAELFKYDICDFPAPFSMKRYAEAIKDVASIHPAVVIIDSMSHAHEGTGGLLDQHEAELDRLAGNDYKKRDKMTWAAWVKPKADETAMINSLLQVDFHLILCFRAKEKIKIVKGKDPIDLGWRPIASDRIHFETAFTLILPPNSKGTPDMTNEGSELRSPFDKMVTAKQLDETLGKQLLEWAKGGATPSQGKAPGTVTITKDQLDIIIEMLSQGTTTDEAKICAHLKVSKLEDIPAEKFNSVVDGIQTHIDRTRQHNRSTPSL